MCAASGNGSGVSGARTPARRRETTACATRYVTRKPRMLNEQVFAGQTELIDAKTAPSLARPPHRSCCEAPPARSVHPAAASWRSNYPMQCEVVSVAGSEVSMGVALEWLASAVPLTEAEVSSEEPTSEH